MQPKQATLLDIQKTRLFHLLLDRTLKFLKESGEARRSAVAMLHFFSGVITLVALAEGEKAVGTDATPRSGANDETSSAF